ncbi:hypothetical protein UFOVP1462_39 [uncultured Caudovirales phage]|uniref:Tail completion protein n=3 Tax=uncultured Caudovirales phage TaxID=2100421 RepID=A0A6J5SJI8_9CAUD|nr:hypothetical protein UFOVP1013_39 [uncultured Caudovirales phage]CAB4214456.1 hypothetical protein UFOVP1462_39 [uncultured Caudovirales phage]CAB5228854.1 hypothetical protein UFOVP1550_48 [uncultured Caudovirales phage]
MIISDIRQGIKDNLSTIDGLRTYDLVPDVIVPPCVVVGQLDFTFDLDNARGLDQANLDVFVIVQRFSERTGQDKLDKYLAGSGNESIKAAIESDRTLGGACDTLRVTSAESGTYQTGDIEYLSYRYQIVVYGQGD